MFINQAFASTSTSTAAAQPVEDKPASFQDTLQSFVPFLLVLGVFYFLVFKPQQRKQKEQAEMVDSVKKGEDIITHSGIYGTIVHVDNKVGTVDLEVSKGVIMKMSKKAVADIVNRKEKA